MMGGFSCTFAFHCCNVLIERMCVVTAIAMRIKPTLTKGIPTTKTVEYPIVAQTREIDNTFVLSGIPFPSR